MVRQLGESQPQDRETGLRQHSVAPGPVVRRIAGDRDVVDHRPQALPHGVHRLFVALPGVDLMIGLEDALTARHAGLEAAADLRRHAGLGLGLGIEPEADQTAETGTDTTTLPVTFQVVEIEPVREGSLRVRRSCRASGSAPICLAESNGASDGE
jgi:hypothetical protein